MAAANLLALIDDIASVLDDVAVLTKAATKKTAGVLGDDLALNAQQVTGVAADRELPVVWAVAKGSLLNKAILVPLALAISAFAPWAVTPLLMVGGAFLCYEGFEKLAHRFLHQRDEDAAHACRTGLRALADPARRPGGLREGQDQGRGAHRLRAVGRDHRHHAGHGGGGAVHDAAGGAGRHRAADDRGRVRLRRRHRQARRCRAAPVARAGRGRLGGAKRALGAAILRAAPWLMKALSVAGTAAMFLVGGGILTHGFAPLHHAIEALAHRAGQMPGAGALLAALTPSLLDAVVGIVAGALVLLLVTAVSKLRGRAAANTEAGAR